MSNQSDNKVRSFCDWILEKADRAPLSPISAEIRTYVGLEVLGGTCNLCNPRIECDPCAATSCSVVAMLSKQLHQEVGNDSRIALAYRLKSINNRLEA